jgi:hypothetical protein
MEAAGERVQVEKETMVVLYDPGTGKIAHVHHVVTTRGGRHPDGPEIERAAQEHAQEAASRRGVARPKKLSALHVDPRSFELNVPYKVDTKTLALVRLKAAKTSRR